MTITRIVDFIPPQALVVLSRALQALAVPVVALLVAVSDRIASEVPDAISFCNLLFVGNMCAAIVVMTTFGPRTIVNDLRKIDRKLTPVLVVFGGLSALLSSLIFGALEHTTVTNVILLARLGPVLFVLGSAIFIGQKIGVSEGVGFGVIGLGVLATVFGANGFDVSTGDLLILASGVVYAVVTMMSKQLLPVTGLPALVFLRNLLGSIIFFWIAGLLYGWDHFAHAFYGPLWGIMVVYALVIIVISQLAWYKGISALSPASVARWTIMTPVIAVGWAYLVNGEEPTNVQLTALGIVMIGVLISNIGSFLPKGQSDGAEGSLAGS